MNHIIYFEIGKEPIPVKTKYLYNICTTATQRLLLNAKHLCNICTMLDQRRRHCADVVQMLCKCFVFAGIWDLVQSEINTYFYTNGPTPIPSYYSDFDRSLTTPYRPLRLSRIAYE